MRVRPLSLRTMCILDCHHCKRDEQKKSSFHLCFLINDIIELLIKCVLMRVRPLSLRTMCIYINNKCMDTPVIYRLCA